MWWAQRREGTSTAVIVNGAPTFVPGCEERLPRARVAQPDVCEGISPVVADPARVRLLQPGQRRPLDRGGVLPQHGGNPPDTRQVGAPDVALVGESECAGRLGRDNLEDGGRELRAVGLAYGGEAIGGRDRERRGRREAPAPLGEGFGDLGGREPRLPVDFAGVQTVGGPVRSDHKHRSGVGKHRTHRVRVVALHLVYRVANERAPRLPDRRMLEQDGPAALWAQAPQNTFRRPLFAQISARKQWG